MDFKLWELRRYEVTQIMIKHNITSLADFGCGDGKLLTYLINYFSNRKLLNLKFLLGSDKLKEDCTLLADKLEKLVSDEKSEVKKRLPFASKKWKKPIYNNFPEVRIITDDILIPNQTIKSLFVENKVEMIAMVEVFEHLHLHQIDRMFETIMNFYQAKFILMTTPNKEYNVIYKLKEDQFRHWDHKFELTRKEFEDICNRKAIYYGYQIVYQGVGDCHETLGQPTQTALFIKNSTEVGTESNFVSNSNIGMKFNLNELIYKREEKQTRLKKNIFELYETLMILEKLNNPISIENVYAFYKFKSVFKKIKLFSHFILRVNKLMRLQGMYYNKKTNTFIFI